MDVKTGIIILVLTTGSMGVAFAILHLATRPLPGPKQWAAGAFVGVIGLLLILGRGQLPGFVSIIVANALTTFFYIAFFDGIRAFLGKPPMRGILAFILAATVGFLTLFTYVWYDLDLRLIVLSLVHGGLASAIAWTLYKTEIEGGRFARLFTIVAFGITSLAIFSPIYLIYTSVDLAQDLMTHPLVGLRLTIAAASSFAWAFGLVLLATQHYVHQTTLKQSALEKEIREHETTEAALRASRRRQQDFADVGSDWFWEMDADLRFTYFSDTVLRYNGGTDYTQHLGKRRDEIVKIRDADRERWKKHFQDLEGHRPFRDFQYLFTDINGKEHWWSISGKPCFDDHGTFTGYRGVGRDITYRKEIEDKHVQLLDILKDNEAQLRGVFNGAMDGIVVIDVNGQIAEINQAAETMFGYQRDELNGQDILTLVPDEHSDAALEKLSYLMEKGALDDTGGEHWEVEFKRRDGDTFPGQVAFNDFELHGNTMFVMVIRDVTEQMEAAMKIRHMATHDALTGLPNLTLGRDRISSVLAMARRSKTLSGVLFIDLDEFKEVNDTLGHDAGDAVLKIVAKRLKNSVREIDTVARIGGDEFIVVLEELHAQEDAAKVAEKIVTEVKEPISFEEKEVFVGASIGIALYPENGENDEDLLKAADRAMYQVKRSGKNGFAFDNPKAA